MITKSSIYHRPKDNYVYAIDSKFLHVRIRSKIGEVKKVTLRIGDPYDWEKGGSGGNLNGENAYNWVGGTNIPMVLEATTHEFDYWFAKVEPEFRRARYAFVLENKEEKIIFGERRIVELNKSNEKKELSSINNFFCFPYMSPMDEYKAPKWVEDAIFYQIFPERFNNGNPHLSPKNALPWGSIDPKHDYYFGGDLQGIIDKVDYIASLGVNAVYLCPIFESSSNHKYDTIDYFKIDPHFGNDETFKELVDKLHDKGIKIMLDAVFNHIGYKSKEFLDVVNKGDKSKYWDWFNIRSYPLLNKDLKDVRNKADINYETFAFTPHMPKLNTQNPEVRKHLIEVGKYWVKKFGIDGWRLDVANEVDHSFWREFRKEIKTINPDIYILGEAWHDAMPWLSGDQFDAVMNYPLTDAIIGYFAKNEFGTTEFINQVNTNIVNYPVSVRKVMFNLLDSHDTTRIITHALGNINRVKMAYAFLFSHTGTPSIYYGGEVGMDGGHDPLCRKCMVWEEEKQNKDMFEYVKTLISLRNENKSLKSENLIWIDLKKENALGYIKKSEGNPSIYCYFNLSDKKIKIKAKYKSGINLFNGEIVGNDELIINPNTFMFIKGE
jgi:glycosidase